MIQLCQNAPGNSVGGVNRGHTVFGRLQQREGCQAKESMEDVDCVARTIANSSFAVLALQDKGFKRLLIDPIFLLHHAKSGVDPPGIADIGKFLWPPVESPLVCLPLTEPFGQQLLVE